MEIRTLIDAYIDVNILLVLSLGIWFVMRRILGLAGFGTAYTTQLRLLSAVFVAVILSPVLAVIVGMISSANSVNLSNFVTAQYLNGSFDMTPSVFENALGFRGRLMAGVQHLNTGLGIALVTILTLGFGVGILRLGLGLHNLRRIVSDSTVWRKFGTLELRVSDTVSIPFSTRTLQRRIVVIPSSILGNPTDLKIALGHEFQHLRQRDLEWEIGLELLKPLFFWNPAFAIWKRKFETLRELSCDQNVLARHGFDLGEYCEGLVRICENALRPKRVFAVEIPRVTLAETRGGFFGGSSASLLRHRLETMLDGKHKRHSKTVFLMAIVPLLAFTLIGALAIQKPDSWSHDRLMLSTIVNLERLAARNDVSAFQLSANR